MFPADYYSKGDRNQEEMKTFHIAFFSDFNQKAARLTLKKLSKSLLFLSKNLHSASPWARDSMRSPRLVTLDILIRKESPGDGEGTGGQYTAQ